MDYCSSIGTGLLFTTTSLCLALFLQPKLVILLELLVNFRASRGTISMVSCRCGWVSIGTFLLALLLFSFLFMFYICPTEETT